MSLSADLSPTIEAHSYQSPTHEGHLQHPHSTHWLTAPSPVAKATSFARPYASEKIEALSLETGDSAMELFNPRPTTSRDPIFEDFSSQHQQYMDNSLSHLHLSTLEHSAPWPSSPPFQEPSSILDVPAMLPPPRHHLPLFSDSFNMMNPSSPYSTASMYDESPLQSPYFSSPEIAYAGFAGQPPRSSPNDEYDLEEEEDAVGEKPYARLIYEALLQAPGHRMMLRDIYDWFEKNTTKPRESGTNGWQNSIRHNLSMNHAFENDKSHSLNARGEPKKATSVWFLTENALRNGVQSTTRYRKNGGARRSALHGRPDVQRQRSGAKGGRAARRAARLRAMEQSPHTPWIPAVTPDDLGSFNNLVNAANALRDFPPPRSSSPPSPPEQYPYTPHSPGSNKEYSMHHPPMTKYRSGDGAFGDYSSQDLLFSQSFDPSFDDHWLQANQRS